MPIVLPFIKLNIAKSKATYVTIVENLKRSTKQFDNYSSYKQNMEIFDHFMLESDLS